MPQARAHAPYPVLLFGLALALSATSTGCTESDPAPRNLLIISIDTLRADHLGAYGHERDTSPALDAFCDTAATFEDAQAHSSWTLPSFASLMTSLYASTHRCWNFKSQLDESFVTLGEILEKHGFRTGAVVSHVFLGRRHGMDQGITDFDDELVLTLKESHEAVTSETITAKGLDWLRGRANSGDDRRWFLWLHYFDPHEVYRTHEGISERFGTEEEIDRYDGEIAFTDRALAPVLETLDRLGLSEDTIVVLVADHGEEFNDHGRYRHGASLYREVVRVPLAIRAPGFQPTRVEQTVRVVDVMPTVLELLKLPIPPASEGQSLVRAMRGERIEERPALAELRLREDFSADSLKIGHWKLIVDHSGASTRSDEDEVQIDENGRRVREIGERAFLLFDVEKDVTEQNDVASEHPEIVARLRKELAQMIERARKLGKDGGYQHADALDLSEEELDQLRKLGYVGR